MRFLALFQDSYFQVNGFTCGVFQGQRSFGTNGIGNSLTFFYFRRNRGNIRSYARASFGCVKVCYLDIVRSRLGGGVYELNRYTFRKVVVFVRFEGMWYVTSVDHQFGYGRFCVGDLLLGGSNCSFIRLFIKFWGTFQGFRLLFYVVLDAGPDARSFFTFNRFSGADSIKRIIVGHVSANMTPMCWGGTLPRCHVVVIIVVSCGRSFGIARFFRYNRGA